MITTFNALNKAPRSKYNTSPGNIRHSCTEGTRQQILDDLMKWVLHNHTPNIYLLCGMSGTGKTTIAYSFCQRLENEGLLGASFFWSRALEETQDIKAVFPTIARELASRFLLPPSELLKVIEENHEIAHHPLEEQFVELIHNPAKHNSVPDKPCVVAFDAFDEFKTVEDACHLLSTLVKVAPRVPNIKFFIASRPILHLVKIFEAQESLFILHNVEKSLVSKDIQQYLMERLAIMRVEKELSESWPTRKEFQAMLDNAGGLFLYASTLCSFLENSDAGEIEANLKQVLTVTSMNQPIGVPIPSRSLDSLYLQVLDAAKRDHRWKDISNVLLVVITSLDPLPIPTIAHLLKITHVTVYSALKRLAAVITIPDDREANNPVLPFHNSFPDFLHDPNRSGTWKFVECKFCL
jgi:hypothetical protein